MGDDPRPGNVGTKSVVIKQGIAVSRRLHQMTMAIIHAIQKVFAFLVFTYQLLTSNYFLCKKNKLIIAYDIWSI